MAEVKKVIVWYIIHGGDTNLWFSGETYNDATAVERFQNLIKDMGFLRLSKLTNGIKTNVEVSKPKRQKARLIKI